MDLGLVENTKFDLRLDKTVKVITTNNGKDVADPGTTEHGGFAQGVCVHSCAAGDKARIKKPPSCGGHSR